MDLVDKIIQTKEETLQFESNPDAPSQRLYYCWDATATISDDKDEQEVNVRKKANVDSSSAALALSGSQLFCCCDLYAFT